MKLALIGATGFVGSAILKEALDRGHEVTAITHDRKEGQPHPKLHSGFADIYDTDELARAIAGHDAVISAFSPPKTDPDIRRKHVQGIKSIIAAMKRTDLQRLLVVGGAGSLEVKPGLRVIDTPDFPAQWKGTAWLPPMCSICCEANTRSNGPTSALRRCCSRARARGSFGSGPINCWSMRRDKAISRRRITPSP